MSVLAFTGFELGDAVELALTGGTAPTFADTAGSPNTTTAWAHRDPETGWGGGSSLQMVAGDQFQTILTSSASPGDEVGFAVNCTTAGTFGLAFLAGGTANCAVKLDFSAGTVTLYRGTIAGTVLATSAAGVLTVGTTYWVQVTVTAREAAASGRLQVKLDNVVVVDTGAGVDCRNTTTNDWDTAGISCSASIDCYVDDLVYGSSGTITGPCYAIRRAPSADGHAVAGTPSAGTDNYAVVDENTPSGTDYVTFTTGQDDFYETTDLPGTPTDVIGTRVVTYARVDTITTHSVHLFHEPATVQTLAMGTTSSSFIFVQQFGTAGYDEVGATFEVGAGTGDLAWLGVETLTTGGVLDGNPVAADEPPYRAVVIPDFRFTRESIDEAESSYEQVGPRPGVPVDQGSVRSRMVLQTSGTMVDSADGLRIDATRAGYPDGDAGFTYSTDGGTTDYGWAPPSRSAGWSG